MWIVKIALRAPYTFTVVSILLMIGGALSLLQMPKDIFPAINIPVVGIIWTYTGMPAQEMERRITTVSERALTTSVNNIEHIESNSFNGIAVIKVYLVVGTSIDEEDTLDFSALQAVRPMIERVPLEQAAEAYAKMMRNEARFRMVIDFSL